MFIQTRPTIGGKVLFSVEGDGFLNIEHVNNAGSVIWKVTLRPEGSAELRDFLNSQGL